MMFDFTEEEKMVHWKLKQFRGHKYTNEDNLPGFLHHTVLISNWFARSQECAWDIGEKSFLLVGWFDPPAIKILLKSYE